MLWILEEKFIKVYQGLKEDNWIFNDEKDIKKFCSLSELGKEASGMSYRARQTPLAQSLHDVWGIGLDYTGEYWSNYTVVKGDDDEERSSWCDKIIYSYFT